MKRTWNLDFSRFNHIMEITGWLEEITGYRYPPDVTVISYA
jgi:hypothetical protein